MLKLRAARNKRGNVLEPADGDTLASKIACAEEADTANVERFGLCIAEFA